MTLSAIAAMASNRVIGTSGDLPWNIPEDFKFFKDKTMGHIMIMGRKTYDSFGGKPLPGRLHVVVTRQKEYTSKSVPGVVIVFHTIDEALAYCQSQVAKWGDEVFVIGGGEIYSALLSQTDRIYLTEIHKEFPGDTHFPEFDKSVFREIERKPRVTPVPFDFVTYEKKQA